MKKKIFYINSEMNPFASVSFQGKISVDIPLNLQNKGNDVRCLMPKYGFISERKYILREVIRLKQILFSFEDKDFDCSAKSAFLPNSRLQVYFLENEDQFGDLNNLLFKSKNGRYLVDNDVRFSFYSLAAIKMLPNLFWYPDIIICNGWTSALVPYLIKKLSLVDKNLSKIKTIFLTDSINKDLVFDYKNFFINDETLDDIDAYNLNQLGCMFANKTIIINNENNISGQLMKTKIFKNSKTCTSISLDDSDKNYLTLLNEIEDAIKSI